MTHSEFVTAFCALAGMTKPGEGPFPWQWDLYQRFIAGDIPKSCNLPTGLGKTSVIHVWLLALATNSAVVPRRLVYVVNRRTVVDQTTNEVVKCRDNLVNVKGVADALWGLCALRPEKPDPEKDRPLAISTLRGQYADNREWSADPARPAVICGTVDMIGSRLLFSGYGCGFKTRPLHAGFLGQDALLVHDEAHLEPAFQDLLLAIENEQRNGRTPDFRPLRVMELTATSRAGGEKPFGLTDEDFKNPTVTQRVRANKALQLHQVEKKLADDLAKYATADHTKDAAVVIFVREVKEIDDVLKKLPKDTAKQLTGTLRGHEREGLIKHPIFQRFLPESNRDKSVTPQPGTVYLVCTSAGEVGVNISADHLVCDLSTFDSMAQRFGRVNRFGLRADTRIDVVHPSASELPSDQEEAAEKKKEKPNVLVFVDAARRRTLELLRTANGDVSPASLGKLHEKAVQEGVGTELLATDRTERLRKYILSTYAPQPKTLPVSDILFDAWALTTVRDKLPGRPHVEPYLHGIGGWEPPTTHVAWREEVWELRTTDSEGKPRVPEANERRDLTKRGEDMLEDYPLKAHELIGDRTDRVFKHLTTIAERHPHLVAWLVDDEGTVQVFTLKELADKDEKDRLNNQTVLLAPQAGGLRDGLLAGDEKNGDGLDVADQWFADEEKKIHRRRRVWSEDERPPRMRLIRQIDFASSDDEDAVRRSWYWYELPSGDGEGSKTAGTDKGITWEHHTHDVVENAKKIGEALLKDRPDLRSALDVAAQGHDLGKKRTVWQRSIGNPNTKTWYAKSAKTWKLREVTDYRHEFGSLADTENHPGFREIESDDAKAFVLHTIATHHGRGRPHFPADEAFDPEATAGDERAIAAAVPQRFARLQWTHGRWGLAYLESLLRAADYAASANPSAFYTAPADKPAPTQQAASTDRTSRAVIAPVAPTPTIAVKVDPTNPGQFFACCGLLELADRLWPGAEGWFADGEFRIAADGKTLEELLRAAQGIRLAAEDEATAEEESEEGGDDATIAPLVITHPIEMNLDWWATKALKTWAGSMKAGIIFQSMCAAIDPLGIDPLNQRQIVYDPVAPVENGKRPPKAKKREPFYFDATRGANALAIDIGYMPDAHGMTTVAAPVVEALCLIGLQRCRPTPSKQTRVFEYCTWSLPCGTSVLPVAVNGILGDPAAARFRFENAFRTGQKKHKAFNPASSVVSGDPHAQAE